MSEPALTAMRSDPSDIAGGARWQPTTQQALFLRSSAYEALYGGAAGGGKSEALLAGAMRWVENPHYRALILRRTYTDLQRSLIDRSHAMFKSAFPNAEYHETKKTWFFPSGAQIQFGQVEGPSDHENYQSAEYSYIAFDELTHFTEWQYCYLLSRARSSKGLPIRIRAASNPGGRGHEWVMRRWGPWLDPNSPVQARPGEVLRYENGDDGERWLPPEASGVLSRVFIPARVSDNPYLTKADPGYEARLRGLDKVTRAQLLDGNWLARPANGELFKAAWFERVGAAPAIADRVRYWDRAATAESEVKKGRDPDYTVGLKLARTRDGLYFVEDVVRFRGSSFEVKRCIRETAALDGRAVTIGLEEDPGSAGKAEIDDLVRSLAGYSARPFRPTGSKLVRARPVSAQCEARNVKLVSGSWNRAFVTELEEFPDGAHDDQVDTLSGAFNISSLGPRPTPMTPLPAYVAERRPRRW